jgi:porin
VDYDALFSGGIDISGKLWGREDDNIGIGYAYLNGGNADIDSSQVAEVYARFVLNDYFDLTADVQYMKDEIDDGDDPDGFIGGLRMTAEF